MSNPNMSVLSDPFLGTASRNPTWNLASGTFGYDNDVDATYVTTGVIPSFVGASLYNAIDNAFSAKIIPAVGDKSFTALVIQANANNYVQMSVGPGQQFRGFVSDNKQVFQPDTDFPDYDPAVHVFWRIRELETKTFFFETSTDGETWTTLGSVGYAWDSSEVTVMFFAGATEDNEIGSPFRAYIRDVNQRPVQLVLSAEGDGTSGGDGYPQETEPLSLRGVGFAVSGDEGTTGPTVQIIRGGVTDFGIWDTGQPDAANMRVRASSASGTVSSTVTRRAWISSTAPSVYRDGSYWPMARYASVAGTWTNIPDASSQWLTNVQMEENNNFGNRLSLDGSSYQNISAYAPQFPAGGSGSGTVIRSDDRALSGTFSGKMIYRGATQPPRVITSGLSVYYPYPTEEGLAPCTSSETIRGSVWISADRPNLQWFASLIQYNSVGAILSATFLNPTITSLISHPGDGSWQQGTVTGSIVSGATKVAVVPVIVWSGVAEDETVYMDSHFITGTNPGISDAPTPYVDPRQIQINIKADEVNYAMNSGFNADLTGWFVYLSGLTGNSASVINNHWDSGVGYRSLGSARVDLTQPAVGTTLSPTSKVGIGSQRLWSGGGVYPQIRGLKIGKTYNFSCWVRKGPGCPEIGMSFYDANGVGKFGSPSVNNGLMYSQAKDGTRPQNVDGDWVRLEMDYTIPEGSLSEFQIWVWVYGQDVIAKAPFSFWVDSVTVTEGAGAKTHFNGDFGSADYLWEATRNNSRTHFYNDLTHKRSRVDQVVAGNVPVGANYLVQYAQPPT